jgi:hypothetical protein
MAHPNLETDGRLNTFQKVMLQWSDLHPYNAVHIYKIAGSLRAGALNEAIASAFQFHGLGVVRLSHDGQSFRHEPGGQPAVEVPVASDDPEVSLNDYCSSALNRPFERPASHPFRFAAISAGPQSHYVILSYDHWIADSYAARLVLRSILSRYLPLAGREKSSPLELYPATYRDVFRGRLRSGELAAAAFRTMRQWNRNRSAWRVACWSNTQWDVGYRQYAVIPGTVARLREFAGANGATVHDVLLAAFGKALAEVMPARGRRHGLALGSIVDMRNIADHDLGRSMGAYLGYYLVRNDADRRMGLDEATRQMAARTRPIKARHRYMDSVVNMQFINTVWPWLSAVARQHFMRKTLPMSGGISNVVVRDAWMNENRNLILDYRRGVSTGPNVPIVLSPTTFGDHLNVGVSYRLAGFSRTKIDALMELFREQIEHPNKASRGELRRPTALTARQPLRQTSSPSPSSSPRLAVSNRRPCQSGKDSV